MGGSPVDLDSVVIPLVEGPRILDVGCGFGKWGYLCLTNYWETRNPACGIRPEIHGCDGYLPNVELARANGAYKECRAITFPPLPFEDRVFDTVLMIEVIEHLPFDKAAELIIEAKRVARQRLVISTPNFPDFRVGHETITGWNELDGHQSYWSRHDLRRLGFKIYGVGLKSQNRILRGILQRLRLLSVFDDQLRPALGGLSLLVPALAQNTVAVWQRT